MYALKIDRRHPDQKTAIQIHVYIESKKKKNAANRYQDGSLFATVTCGQSDRNANAQ